MKTQTAPLRKVVRAFVDERQVEREELECGHVVRRKEDIYGPTNAIRRRCRACHIRSTDGDE